MSEAESQEQQLLEEKLRLALEDAWTKARDALEEAAKAPEAYGKKVWLAAEAAEFSSLLYSLTYGMEEVNPPLRETKGRDTLSLVKESVEALNRIRTGKKAEHKETYETLRNAAHSLRTAYLTSLKATGKSR